MKKLVVLISSLAIFSCSSNDDEATPVTPAPVNNSITYFYSKIDNVSVTFDQENNTNPTSVYAPSVGYSNNGGDYYFYYGSGMERNNMTDPTNLDLTFNNMYHSATFAEETTNFYTNFDTKPTNFLTATQESNEVKGISLSYTDANGDFYTTLEGSQTGSTIAYTSSTQGTSVSGDKTVTITGTVNCKLYKQDDPTIVKTLTNGSFKLTFHEFD